MLAKLKENSNAFNKERVRLTYKILIVYRERVGKQ